MTETITSDDLPVLRMRALGLTADAAGSGAGAGSGSDRVAAVAHRMLAVQGQDWRSSRWALGARAANLTGSEVGVADVAAAFTEGRIVRSWPVRGTIHVVPAEDVGWIQAATNRKPVAGAARRRELLGMSDEVLDRLIDVSREALAGLAARGEGLDRDGLAAAWTEAGIDWKSAWRYHVIWWLCQNGLATFGPTDGSVEPRLVLAEEWIRHPRTPDDPLAELAARYAAARGPVRAKDLAWWAGLTAAEAGRGLEAAAESGALERVRLAGVSGAAGALWASPEVLGSAAAVPDWLLLPSFDEHLLGYAVRDAQLAPEHFERIVPGRNGVFLATVVHRGRVAGTWRRNARKGGGIGVAPFPGARIDPAALASEHARWSEFHGLEPGPVELAEAAGG
ncbi:winged helix DNA-binding domain-containing protein [Leucobacter sp. wl10]|uniref:winged helix DNA-binding domain-containing protein n=1 Tax=Leucobacter sp. wl10 TaxID=2304677 RepID=UPI000E5BB79B|nr:winged helix DNA-binding domain-containing protein [Leucobacter sp. wl10]RGE20061.1 winged helix DNA-binding domain-containing protein [Leucobacter sp. wl10]